MAVADAPLVHSLYLLQIVKYTNVASFVVLVYNYLGTLSLEVELVWKTKWGVANALFFLSRYMPFVDVPMVIYYALGTDISTRACHLLYSISAWMTILSIGLAEVILMLRTYALSGNNRSLLIFLTVFFWSIGAPALVILALFLKSLKYDSPPIPGLPGCYPSEGSSILFADFALILFMECVIAVLTIWFGIRRFRDSRSHVVATLYRDGVFYFVYLALISLGNIIVLAAGPPELLDLLNTFQRVMHSILSTRILLHVRLAARKQKLIDLDMSRTRDEYDLTVAHMQFGDTYLTTRATLTDLRTMYSDF